MTTFQVVLNQKVKKIVPAETAAQAVEQAMKEVAEEAQVFTPSTWTVKEKEIE